MDRPVILITGALTGIGRAAAVAFAKKGTYAYECTVPGHAALGMQTSFKVSGGTTSGSGWG